MIESPAMPILSPREKVELAYLLAEYRKELVQQGAHRNFLDSVTDVLGSVLKDITRIDP